MNDWGGWCMRTMRRVVDDVARNKLELKEIRCAFIERKMECRRSPAGHGRRQPGALWGGWLAAVVADVHGGGSHVAPRRVGSGCVLEQNSAARDGVVVADGR